MDPLKENTTNASKFELCVTETATDSGAGETIAANGIHLPGLPHGHRMAARCLPQHPQGWSGRRGRTNGRGIRARLRREPPPAARPRQVRHVPGATRATGTHPEGRLGYRDPTDRNP